MATTLTPLPLPSDQFTGDYRGFSWGPLLNGEAGATLDLPAFGDRTVQIAGTFGAGGTIVIEGSLDGTNWITMNNIQGTALSFTAAGLRAVSEATRYIRPRVTAGDGTTSLTVTIFVRK
jgi:hypothetical protein